MDNEYTYWYNYGYKNICQRIDGPCYGPYEILDDWSYAKKLAIARVNSEVFTKGLDYPYTSDDFAFFFNRIVGRDRQYIITSADFQLDP